jgi:hypothetical protein
MRARNAGSSRRPARRNICFGQLQHARGIGDDLHRLNAADVVEEPSAAGVHELRVALHLHQLQRAHPLRL